MRLLLVAFLFAISYAQTVPECQWQYGIPGSINAAHVGNDRRNLIVNGDTAEVNEYPWHAELNGCGATLIGREWVITAGHCFDPTNPLGTLADTETDPNAVPTVSLGNGLIQQPALAVFIHPGYDDDSIDTKFDIALIQIEPLDCNNAIANGINAIELFDDTNGFDFNGCTAFLVGYGALFSGADIPTQLLEVITEVHDYATCNRFPAMVHDSHVIDDQQLCSFAAGTNEDTCQGDSGGPLYVDIDPSSNAHTYIDAGIVSYGNGCANTQPGIYTKISSYKQWVRGIFPAAPFRTTETCDRGDFNEGPTPDEIGDDPQYTPAPLVNLAPGVLNSCEMKYLTQSPYETLEYGSKFDDDGNTCAEFPNCKVCKLDFDTFEPIGCLTCDAGFEVALPLASDVNYGGDDPEIFCTGTCVPQNTNTLNNQATSMSAFMCDGDPCLAELPSGGTLSSFKFSDGTSVSMILSPVDADVVPVSFSGSQTCGSTILTSDATYYIPGECVEDALFDGYAKMTCISESEMNVISYTNADCIGRPTATRTFVNRQCSPINDPGLVSPLETVLFGAPCINPNVATTAPDPTFPPIITTTTRIQTPGGGDQTDVEVNDGNEGVNGGNSDDGVQTGGDAGEAQDDALSAQEESSDSSLFFLFFLVVGFVGAFVLYWKIKKKDLDSEQGGAAVADSWDIEQDGKIRPPPLPTQYGTEVTL